MNSMISKFTSLYLNGSLVSFWILQGLVSSLTITISSVIKCDVINFYIFDVQGHGMLLNMVCIGMCNEIWIFFYSVCTHLFPSPW